MKPTEKHWATEEHWAKFKEAYPDAMAIFSTWIDEYKKRVFWKQLFYKDFGIGILPPRFDEIPAAMQVGIFLQFASENNFADPLMIEIKHKTSIDEIFTWIGEYLKAEQDRGDLKKQFGNKT